MGVFVSWDGGPRIQGAPGGQEEGSWLLFGGGPVSTAFRAFRETLKWGRGCLGSRGAVSS